MAMSFRPFIVLVSSNKAFSTSLLGILILWKSLLDRNDTVERTSIDVVLIGEVVKNRYTFKRRSSGDNVEIPSGWICNLAAPFRNVE